MKPNLNQHQQFDTYQVICPYCGYEPDETYPEPNEEWKVEECGRCEKKFYASAAIRYDSKKDCKLNGAECELVLDIFMNSNTEKYNWFNCKNCQDTKTVLKTPEQPPTGQNESGE